MKEDDVISVLERAKYDKFESAASAGFKTFMEYLKKCSDAIEELTNPSKNYCTKFKSILQ